MNQDRLAVLIGSQSRGVSDTHETINFFLQLFNIPYDIYICSDESDLQGFNDIKNIKECISLEQIESENKWLTKHKSIMHKHYWQNAKLFGVSELFKKQKHKYTHALKMRTDFMFDYRSYYIGQQLNPDIITKYHLDHLIDDLRLHRHHCHRDESRAWRGMYAPDNRITPLLYNGDRFIFSSAEKTWKYCYELMKTAANIVKIYSDYYNLPMHPDFLNVTRHLETLSIPRSFFPEKRPVSGEQIATYLNENKDFLKQYNKSNNNDTYYEPIADNNQPHCGKDIFCRGKFNADVLAFINQLYVPFIKPSKYGIVKYMHFTRYDDNVKFGEKAGSTIKQAFHDDDTSYQDSITIQNKLIKIKNANIS